MDDHAVALISRVKEKEVRMALMEMLKRLEQKEDKKPADAVGKVVSMPGLERLNYPPFMHRIVD